MEVILPRSLDELWPALTENPDAVLMAGGTDLTPARRKGLIRPAEVICLERIDRLHRIERTDREIRLGAMVTHERLAAEAELTAALPLLAQACAQVGGPQIRRMGTLGGNLCTASPAGDALPPLYAHGAEVELTSAKGSRRLPVSEFIVGPGQTGLAKGEILTAVLVPVDPKWNLHHFEKVGKRNALAISLVSLAALIARDDSGRVTDARLAWGSVGPTVVAGAEAEEALVGSKLEPTALNKAAEAARQAVMPISDLRASAEYRRLAAGNLILRLEALV